MEAFFEFFDSFPAWIAALTAFVTAAAGIAALTPTRADNKVIDMLLRVLNVLAINVGQAKNADDTE
tara:strand:- start:833 stop:1030 length:198 start_codon:yes stop_codon:yes gene_type:complete